MRRFQRTICLILIGCMLCMLCSCDDFFRQARNKRLIAQQVEHFEECVHTLDLDGLLDCFDPADVVILRTVLSVDTGTSEKNDEDEESTVAQLLYQFLKQWFSNLEWPEKETREALVSILKSVSIRPDEISFPTRRTNDEALANCVMEIETGNQTLKSRLELNMIKSDGIWYIDLYH